MNGTERYRAEDFTTTIPVAEYIGRFRDAERFLGFCRSCRNYGRSWGCPPFDFDAGPVLRHYRTALLVATRITPERAGLPMSAAAGMIRQERIRLERRLLDMERRREGRAFSYVGTCLYCPGEDCTRPDGLPCRHPDLVRPSLEAFGFDIGRTVSELFGFDLRWSSDGRLPEYLTLVCGFFHNGEPAEW